MHALAIYHGYLWGRQVSELRTDERKLMMYWTRDTYLRDPLAKVEAMLNIANRLCNLDRCRYGCRTR